MTDIIIIAILAAVIGGAARYVYKAKKNGAKCIGCPDGGCSCSAGKGDACGCGCGCQGESK